jgi:DNA replication protein DnaC
MLESDSNLELLIRLRTKIAKHKVCGGVGKVLKDGQVHNCECLQESLYQFRLSHSGIPVKYRTMGFKDYIYREGEAFKKIQVYLTQAEESRQQGLGLFLYGPSYTGKSLLSCSLLMELMRKGYDCKFYYFGGLLDDKESMTKVQSGKWDFLCIDGVSDVLNRLTNFKEAVLTGERIHQASEFLQQIVASRVNSGLPVIITSEVSLLELNKQFPGLVNTMIGNCQLIECEDRGFKQKRLNQMMEQQ